MPQDVYKTDRWRKKRHHILVRDGFVDQVALRDGVKIEADTGHHILPLEQYPEYAWKDWNLISVNRKVTHSKRLHNVWNGELTKLGKALMYETAAKNGIPLKMVTLVIGMPGTGKSTYVKNHLQGGIVYELDAIACAFRLTVPHKEEPHAGARRMAAALRSGWLQAAKEYANNIWIVRTAPDEEELEETKPDRIIVCTKQWAVRPYEFDRDVYQKRIDAVVEWANANDVPVEAFPPK